MKIDVPFSLEEITILQDARNLRALLKDEMLKSSGWQTEAYLISVPWGYVLKGRKSSLEQLNRLKSLMIQIQDPRFKNHSDTDIAQRPQDFSEKMLDLINQII
ncbi:MAG: hypothetical protein H6772_01960 [Pseudomonadales bacterium]|nr:hypothetical protein [Pseudomonadales bacterium]